MSAHEAVDRLRVASTDLGSQAVVLQAAGLHAERFAAEPNAATLEALQYALVHANRLRLQVSDNITSAVSSLGA